MQVWRVSGDWHLSGQIGLAESQDCIFETITFLLHPLHQPARPNKFRSKQREAQNHDEPTGAWSKEHNEAHKKKCETRRDSEHTADLLDCAEEHEASGPGQRPPLIVKGTYPAKQLGC